MATVIRKNFNNLSKAEKTRIVSAFLRLKSHDVEINAPSTTGGTYQKYVRWHNDAAEHQTTSFLAWHRAFLYELEEDLITADKALGNDGNVAIPYWKWEENDGLPGKKRGNLWAADLLGGNGVAINNNQVKTGSFVMPAWKIFGGSPLVARAEGLKRELGITSKTMPTDVDIKNALNLTVFDLPPFTPASPSPAIDPLVVKDINKRMPFRNVIEGWKVIRVGSTNLHNNGHVWVGGDMLPFTSPNDPVFFFNHSYVDLLWAQWQFKNPALANQHPTDAEIDAVGQSTGGQPAKPNMPRKLNDIMTPWDGSAGTHTWRVKDTFNLHTMSTKIPITPPLLPTHDYTYDALGSTTLKLT